ncbi:MAG: hypothetical protein IK027_01585, partial [Deltaproteobacteria bacterium]|nr:hypothetical protein [Deltaproteobacteria bacterium]
GNLGSDDRRKTQCPERAGEVKKKSKAPLPSTLRVATFPIGEGFNQRSKEEKKFYGFSQKICQPVFPGGKPSQDRFPTGSPFLPAG